MNTITLGKARIETGVRIEATKSQFTGYHVTFDSSGAYVSTTPVSGDTEEVLRGPISRISHRTF